MGAVLSPCGVYRYRLERQCAGEGSTAIIMVNPSTADAEKDDATIRKLRGFGDRNEWGRIIVGNLFAYRATDVRQLAKVSDPVGPDCDQHLEAIFAAADRLIYAWGPLDKQPRLLRGRWRYVDKLARHAGLVPHSIGPSTKSGHPCHPLMLAYSEPIIDWNQP